MTSGSGFLLRPGDQGPVQQSQVSCGAACLTVARMLVNPQFARWITTGQGPHVDAPPGPTEAERFAAYERVVMNRTNRLYAGGRRLNVPWPKALGTPPWGAKKELEFGAARRGSEYTVEVVRGSRTRQLRAAHARLVELVDEGEPALLYAGNAVLPRHVALVLPGDGQSTLEVYDPATGLVTLLDAERFARRRLRLSGWDVPWFVVQPDGLRRVQAFGFSTGMSTASRTSGVSASA
ncbi:hypothetical protein SAMN05216199_2081 [Pedococcus cremeus]|uniref:Peptidase C39-like domain-containing protein n=1 Tax=Pedococcus cremeus TaxID=587636 RepID=A0A1H9UT18_9MICO|nr:hypothetical protein [Pedococcus cremeus]SES12274.1 hypothetical protein SAMN05216199_2081 [Pedococcus cremeus]